IVHYPLPSFYPPCPIGLHFPRRPVSRPAMPPLDRSRRSATCLLRLIPLLFLLLPIRFAESRVSGECVIDRAPSGPAAPFLRHLGTDCSERERDTHAV